VRLVVPCQKPPGTCPRRRPTALCRIMISAAPDSNDFNPDETVFSP
jgi:hypothetical protein